MSNETGVPPEPTPSDLFAGLRYYPVFAVLVVAGFVGSTILTTAFVTHRFVDQMLVPIVHPVELRPGDVVEVGSSGAVPGRC